MYLRLCSIGLIALAGCAGPTSDAPKVTDPTEHSPNSAVAGRPYTISVQSMTWGSCAASVRGDLTKTDGFSNVRTDLDNRICSFDYSKSDAELKAQLDELGKSNPHLRDWRKKNWAGPATP